MSEDLRERVSKLEARQDMFEKWIGQIREDIREIRDTLKNLIDRTARLEERVNHLEERVSSLGEMVKRIESRLWWIIGILITMWITIILTILFK